MKRTTAVWLVASLLILAPAGGALAGDTDIGCGPGTQIWDGNSGLAPKVLGATTNGTFGLQTFGITFGTIGCNSGGTVTADARLRHFAAGNLDQLAEDMARGDGDALETFAHLMGIPEQDRPVFYGFAKQHFAEIFAGDEVTERDMIAALQGLLADEDTLAVYVGG